MPVCYCISMADALVVPFRSEMTIHRCILCNPNFHGSYDRIWGYILVWWLNDTGKNACQSPNDYASVGMMNSTNKPEMLLKGLILGSCEHVNIGVLATDDVHDEDASDVPDESHHLLGDEQNKCLPPHTTPLLLNTRATSLHSRIVSLDLCQIEELETLIEYKDDIGTTDVLFYGMIMASSETP